MRSLEEFVCLMYDSRRVKKADDLRHQLLKKNYQQKNKKSLIYIYLLLVNRFLDCTLFDVTFWPISGKTQTYVLYKNPQLLIMVGLRNVNSVD